MAFWIRVDGLRRQRKISKRNVAGIRQCILDILKG